WDQWFDDVLWGDEKDDGIPELTMITLSESKERLVSLMDKIKPWWKLQVTPDDVYKDFSEVLKDKIDKVAGEIGEDIDEIEYEQKFKDRVSEILDECDDMMERGIINSIISGTKKTLIDREVLAKSLDERGILHDNKTVMNVRQEIFSLSKKVIEKFASSLAFAINEILEEI
ncbi:MAG: hypothetical protein BV458_09965, partial [Thermoplasmata archaeon M9B2D]